MLSLLIKSVKIEAQVTGSRRDSFVVSAAQPTTPTQPITASCANLEENSRPVCTTAADATTQTLDSLHTKTPPLAFAASLSFIILECAVPRVIPHFQTHVPQPWRRPRTSRRARWTTCCGRVSELAQGGPSLTTLTARQAARSVKPKTSPRRSSADDRRRRRREAQNQRKQPAWPAESASRR